MATLPATTSQVHPRAPISVRISLVSLGAVSIWLLIGNAYGEDYSRARHTARAFTAFGLGGMLVALTLRFLDRESWESVGLISLRRGWRALLIGMASWSVPAGVGLAGFLATDAAIIQLRTTAMEASRVAIALVVLVFIYEAFPEELIFRGYLYSRLRSRLSASGAVIGQAILFALWGHFNGGENSVERTMLFLGFAIVAGALRAITGTIWASIGFHWSFQVVVQLLGSVGGQFDVQGLENLTIVAFVVLPFLCAGSLSSVACMFVGNIQETSRGTPAPR